MFPSFCHAINVIPFLGNSQATDKAYYMTFLGTIIDTDGGGSIIDAQKRIKELMEERGWTEYRLAKEANLSHSTVSKMFNRNNAPTLPTIEAVCRAFGLTLVQFFSEGDSPAELTEEQRNLFANWSTMTDEQKKALLQLMNTMK